ncbi:MAG: aminotransferase class V-fold PLP-dependent enzyme [Candidatus Poseidoniaceae archaeon]|nr:aminotransferase class V-fold PLP-dependent enzyme [Candidatus Poseidoniaceae archaeon]
MDTKSIREDFPTLREVDAPAYLDNACVTLKPDCVINAITEYYTKYPGCGGRSVHSYGTQVSKKVSDSRRSLASFLNAPSVNEVVFTKNATQSLNQIAHGMKWSEGDVVLTTDREHNSNLVPWLQLEQEQGIDHRVVPSNADNTFDLESFEEICSEVGNKLKLVSMSHVGNLDGVSTPIKEIAKVTHDHGALIAVDGAQSLPHMKVDVQDLDIDFIAFSIHKMCGPSGMGGLWGKSDLLDDLRPIQSGGQTVVTSNYDSLQWAKPPARFEGGLGNFSGMIGAGAAIDYLAKLDMDAVREHEVKLNKIMTSGVKDLNGIELIGPEDANLRGGICSLLLHDLPAHDIAILLDEAAAVMVRSGQHCVHSWFNDRGHENGSLRASAYMYNTEEEAKLFSDTLEEIVNAFS